MKILIVAAALITSGTAVAQQRDSRGIPVTSEAATAPSGANQAVDAPAGTQTVPNPNQQAVFAPQPATGPYPACARGQTDRCTQTYEGRATHSRRRR